jgi:serine/threonine protein kinase
MLPLTPAEQRDQRLAQLLADLSEQMRQGRPPDLNAVAAQHPDLAAELRELWDAVLLAEELMRGERGCVSARREQSLGALTQPRLPGSFGDYELLEEIGRGGMGMVYKARQRSLNRLVALKMILRGELATPEDLARFRTEAQATAHLEHPNIVPVYNAGVHEGQAYFSMRLVEGQTLAALLARGPLRPRDAARYLAAISRAVQYAHEHGILHRDLKPSNILIDQKDEPHITDFGLAKRTDWTGGTAVPPTALTATGAIIGTPAYMAPEQVSNRRGTPSPASDVYSLGVILYEMLTGRPPFQAPMPIDTLLLVLDQDPVPPRLFNPGVDTDLEMVCLKCIQKEPELRYASAGALAADLEAYLHGESLSVRSGRLASIFNRTFRETPHAVVMENFGLLWMLHSVVVLLMCGLTTWLACQEVKNPLWYLLLWGGGLIVWAFIFWQLRKRAGPVLFVERQVAHVWGGAIAATIGVFVVEYLLGLEVLKLAPMLAVIAGITFAVKAGMLSGVFYIAAAAEFLTAVPMALPPFYPRYGILLFGMVTAVCFFLPGLKYHRQRLRAKAGERGCVNAPSASHSGR